MGAQFKKFNNKIYFIMAREGENKNAFLKLIKTEFAQFVTQRLASLFHFFRNIKNHDPPFSIPFFRLFNKDGINIIPQRLFDALLCKNNPNAVIPIFLKIYQSIAMEFAYNALKNAPV